MQLIKWQHSYRIQIIIYLIDYGAHIPSKAVFLVSMVGGLDALKYLFESNVQQMLKSVMTMIYCIGILAYKSRNFGQKMNLRNLSNSTYTRAIKQDNSRLRFLKSINNLSNTIYQIKRAVFLVFMVEGLDALKYLIENNTYRC